MIFKNFADQDWIGLMIFKNFADQDWTRTEKFHSPFISAVLGLRLVKQLLPLQMGRV